MAIFVGGYDSTRSYHGMTSCQMMNTHPFPGHRKKLVKLYVSLETMISVYMNAVVFPEHTWKAKHMVGTAANTSVQDLGLVTILISLLAGRR